MKTVHPATRWLSGATMSRSFPTISTTQHSRPLNAAHLYALGLDAPPPSPPFAEETLDCKLRDDVQRLLPGRWLVRTDRAAMANGLELRCPFLDVNLASFCVSLPLRFKIRGREEKWILRRAFEDRWTSAVKAKRKQGFNPNTAVWLKRPDMKELLRTTVDNPRHRLYDLVHYEGSRNLARSENGQWILLTAALWAEYWLP